VNEWVHSEVQPLTELSVNGSFWKLFTFSVDFGRISSCSSNIRMVCGFGSANNVACSNGLTSEWSSRLWR